MRIDRLGLGPLETNCWVVSDDAGGPAIVIDPGGEPERVLGCLGSRGLQAVVLTHAHFDHLGGVEGLVEATGAPLMVHSLDAPRLVSDEPAGTGGRLFGFAGMVSPAADRLLEDGDVIEAGALTLAVVHTPGHTEGGICLLASEAAESPAHLFSGDTLFAGSVGRTDFPGGDGRTLMRSLAKLAPLDPATVVHPGHGPDTNIGREARLNPFWPRA